MRLGELRNRLAAAAQGFKDLPTGRVRERSEDVVEQVVVIFNHEVQYRLCRPDSQNLPLSGESGLGSSTAIAGR